VRVQARLPARPVLPSPCFPNAQSNPSQIARSAERRYDVQQWRDFWYGYGKRNFQLHRNSERLGG
jgi:hypothetical protein